MAAGMGSNDLMELLLDLDAQDAEATVNKLGDKMDKAIEKTDKIENRWTAVVEKLKLGAVNIGVWGKLIDGIKMAFKAVHDAVSAFSDLVGSVHAKFDQLGTARIFGVTTKDAESLSGILTDVKSKMEALGLATEMRQIGLSQEETQRMAHLVNILAAVTGETKANLEAKIKTAQLTDRELGALSKLTGELKTQQGLQVNMLKAQAQAGGRALDLGERIRSLIQYTGASKQLEASLGEIGLANPFDELAKQAKTLYETVIKDLMPSIRATAQALADLGKIGVSVLSSIWSGFKKFSEAVGEGAARLWVRLAQGKQAIKWVDELDIRIRENHRSQVARDKARAESLKQQHAQTKQQLQEQQEALQEQISRMAAARALLRNFDRSALSLVSREGARGVGAIIAGMAASIEMAKQFTALMGPEFEKRSKKAAELFNLSVETGRGGLIRLIEGEKSQTAAMESQLTISNAMKESLAIQREESDRRRSLGEATRAIDQALVYLGATKIKQAEVLRQKLVGVRQELVVQTERQILLLRIREQIAALTEKTQLRAEALEFSKAQITAGDELVKQLRQIAELEGRIVRDRGEAARAAAAQAAIEVEKNQNTLVLLEARLRLALNDKDKAILRTKIAQETTLAEISRQRLFVLRAEAEARAKSAALADVQYKIEQKRTALTRAGEVSEAEAKIRSLQASLSLRAGDVSSTAQIRTLNQQIAEQQASIASLNKQVGLVSSGSEKERELRKEIEFRNQILKLRQDELTLTQQQAEKEKERRTVLGSFMQTMQEQALGLQQKLGQEIAQGITGIAQGMTNSLGQMFSDLITKPQEALGNLGKAILGAFGDMAFKLAAFFAAEALGLLFTPGGQGAAAGLFAAAAGMAGVGGILKGVAAGIPTATTSAAGLSSTSSSTSSTTRTSIPGSDRPREQAPIQIFVSVDQEPWAKPTPQERYKGFTRWAEQMGRSTGIRRFGT